MAVMKPSPGAISQAVKMMKPHNPLIKFRKGSHGASPAGHVISSSVPPSPAHAAAATRFPAAPSTPLKPNQAMRLPIIEDWQLPMRFRRRPVDQEEIDYINRGGPQ